MEDFKSNKTGLQHATSGSEKQANFQTGNDDQQDRNSVQEEDSALNYNYDEYDSYTPWE